MPEAQRPIWLLCLIFALAGCAAASESRQDSPASLWGAVRVISETEQSHAPALWVQPDGILTAAWVGADNRGVHHDARVISGSTMGDAVTLPLPPIHPYGQQLWPASGDHLHLLWLDAGADGQQRLFAAHLSPDLGVERGPVEVSDRQTLDYAAIAAGSGQVVTVWSGGSLAEPALYAQSISARGIPSSPVLLKHNAAQPALTRTNDGTIHVFWLDTTDHGLRYGQLQRDALLAAGSTGHSLHLGPGDRLHSLSAGTDAAHLYLFWNITRLDGTDETWMTARPLDTGEWSAPLRVGVGGVNDATMQTGLNTGTVHTAAHGDNWLRWGAPMPGQFDVLPLAGAIGSDLVIVHFRQGVLAGYQRIAPVRALIGPPALLTDRDRYLYLTWAEPTDSGRAALKITTSRG
ncbi:MAG TPA: hypothetical protein VKY59_04690 [Spirillospora sp.]|nr:hypothetical protein [Spirillospora sp.]